MTDSNRAVLAYRPLGPLTSWPLPRLPMQLRNMLQTLLTWKFLTPVTFIGLVFFCKFWQRYGRRWRRLPFFMGACCRTQEKTDTPTDDSPVYVGLRNEGSTCYLNSILQCLFMAKDFHDNILRIPEDTSSHHVRVFQDLFNQLRRRQSPPSTLNLMRCFGIKEGTQDVEEHFRILINSLPQEIQQLFRIQMVHCLTCKGCKHEDIMPNPMLCLPLAIKDQAPSVDGALRDFLEENVLDLDNQCYCLVCRRKEDASSRHYFSSLPKILVVHLKRYKIYQGQFDKISELVFVPNSLAVPVEKSQEAATVDTRQHFTIVDMGETGEHQQHKHQDLVKYTLFAICNHYGGLHGGHYIAEIMSFDNKHWYTFNDTEVKEFHSSKEREIYSDSAYLLMYYQDQEEPKFLEKEDLQSDIPSHLMIFQ